MEKMVKFELKYDELLEKIPYKYAIPVVVAKRAEAIREYARPFVITEDENPVSIAFMELSMNYIRIKNEDILKALIPKVK
ncbi:MULTISPECIES: DNA-directed RNA polymerase subunit omega [Thermotoga]|uniref:DNA-directed RNA polymerase subunit omega n=1 Tax=Thermotoga neapolitana (strain ATCC 49049 / DSM 4359 / NBRC 107923 / NS-E) TaxID=309803 RepID=RPOZ_THENN|nr:MULTISPECIES: DNA-directed RNA polymerase subunit omega [Thermotoga]B9K7W8.1 RecName: Full=DNA-directed RNA polymerase subunit omega; Short=RNAP omega subunit; AltName: Full=RNA polymerase omega subunit; AltName: Full=Transcriptase subunit omega [Thermotoga neapolitana DSM 4359]HBF11667.1 DNA-directed RNA polymerase subunit omega [Thermotoga neapolitana]ACM23051.1 DNA-directed RNA polymerase subunit omega [Thermotoga neapolitana DSM 4359]AJG40967.1 DNA-directed RNA polymerase subunit omega [